MNNRKTGDEKEVVACRYLEQQGMHIVERNFHSSRGELDIVGYHEGYLVFVEVKYRQSTNKGRALEAVNYKKQCRICRTADYYRYLHHVSSNQGVRYDVLAIQGEEIQWIKNAFYHIYKT